MDSIHFSIDSDGSVYLSRDDEAGCHAPNGGTPAQGQGPSRGPAGGARPRLAAAAAAARCFLSPEEIRNNRNKLGD
jgi:hypothetical protein